MPAFINNMRALFSSAQYISNVDLDNNLKSILLSVKKIDPYLYPSFSAMYYCGCRASESINADLWTIKNDHSYILTPLKNNNERVFESFEVPFEFQLFLENMKLQPTSINYEKLRYRFKSFSLYPRIWIGKKESTCHLFRHNYVKRLMSAGYSHEEIRIKLGEKNLSSAMSYIESRFRI